MIHRFDDFELDTERFELRRAGKVRHIEPMVFDFIVFLACNPGRVISRDEVIDHVWRGRIVSDATVSSCVKSVRKALDDSGARQTYLQTVRGRGFRFVAGVSTAGAAAEADDRDTGPDGVPVAIPEPGERKGPPVRSEKMVLAVLPFDNLSAEVEDYFADGLTGDIITNLSRFRELQVIARASSFRFRERGLGLSEFCTELGAGYAVEGSVRRARGRVRITAQLIDAASGVHLWANSYDREMEDIFAVQDEVTRMIAATLGAKLQDVALQHALKKSSAELDAYDCVLRARRFTSLLSADSHAEARDLLERAVALDPGNSDAHALLANVYLAEHRFETNPRPDPIGRALKMAQKATELDQQSSYARCWLAFVHFFRGEADLFALEAQRALDLNPNDPETLADVGHFLAFAGQHERGLALSQQARRLNPLHPGWYHFTSARYHFGRGEYDETLSDVQRIGMPHFYWSQLLNAAALGHLGRPQAADALARIFEIKPDFAAGAELRKWQATPQDFEHLMDGLRKAGLDE